MREKFSALLLTYEPAEHQILTLVDIETKDTELCNIGRRHEVDRLIENQIYKNFYLIELCLLVLFVTTRSIINGSPNKIFYFRREP